MKTTLKNVFGRSVAVCALLAGVMQASSQSQVGVDSSQTWGGWMNVSELNGTYLWGSGWGTADLTATVSGGVLTLGPNVNCYNAADPYWVNGDGSGNKKMEANYYVDTAAYGGTTLTFSGKVLSYTLASGYQTVAVIKEFAPGYSWIGMTTVALVDGQDFSVSRTIAAGDIVQYGFMTVGAVANPATVASLGTARIAVVPEPSSLALLGLGWLGLLAWRRK